MKPARPVDFFLRGYVKYDMVLHFVPGFETRRNKTVYRISLLLPLPPECIIVFAEIIPRNLKSRTLKTRHLSASRRFETPLSLGKTVPCCDRLSLLVLRWTAYDRPICWCFQKLYHWASSQAPSFKRKVHGQNKSFCNTCLPQFHPVRARMLV